MCLAKRTNSISSKINPVHIGVYNTGSGYAYWNGTKWEPYKNWSNSINASEFFWCGLDREGPYCDELIVS